MTRIKNQGTLCAECGMRHFGNLFTGAAYNLERVLDQIGEDVTLADVERHPELGILILLADELGNRVRIDALDYCKRRL